MISYKVHGTGDDTIVLLHGLGQFHKAFDEQLELADEYKLIIPDLRGHGDSNLEGDITLAQMVVDVIELMDHLHIENATFLGVSLGGLVCQEIYKQNSDRVKSLILCNTYSYVPDFFLRLEIENRKHRLDSMSDGEYITAIAKKCSLSQCDDVLSKIINTFRINRDAYIQCASAPIGQDYRDVIRSMDIPVLLISGWMDIVTPIALQCLQHIAIKGSKHIKFYCGHLPNIECTAEFNCEVRKFLRGVYNGL